MSGIDQKGTFYLSRILSAGLILLPDRMSAGSDGKIRRDSLIISDGLNSLAEANGQPEAFIDGFIRFCSYIAGDSRLRIGDKTGYDFLRLFRDGKLTIRQKANGLYEMGYVKSIRQEIPGIEKVLGTFARRVRAFQNEPEFIIIKQRPTRSPEKLAPDGLSLVSNDSAEPDLTSREQNVRSNVFLSLTKVQSVLTSMEGTNEENLPSLRGKEYQPVSLSDRTLHLPKDWRVLEHLDGYDYIFYAPNPANEEEWEASRLTVTLRRHENDFLAEKEKIFRNVKDLAREQDFSFGDDVFQYQIRLILSGRDDKAAAMELAKEIYRLF